MAIEWQLLDTANGHVGFNNVAGQNEGAIMDILEAADPSIGKFLKVERGPTEYSGAILRALLGEGKVSDTRITIKLKPLFALDPALPPTVETTPATSTITNGPSMCVFAFGRLDYITQKSVGSGVCLFSEGTQSTDNIELLTFETQEAGNYNNYDIFNKEKMFVLGAETGDFEVECLFTGTSISTTLRNSGTEAGQTTLDCTHVEPGYCGVYISFKTPNVTDTARWDVTEITIEPLDPIEGTP